MATEPVCVAGDDLLTFAYFDRDNVVVGVVADGLHELAPEICYKVVRVLFSPRMHHIAE